MLVDVTKHGKPGDPKDDVTFWWVYKLPSGYD